MTSLNDTLQRWRRDHIWAILWVLSVFIICKGFLFQHSPLPASEAALHNSTHPENSKYYNTHTVAIDDSSPALNPYIFLNVSTSPKVAVIIETRAPGYLVPLILHFSSVLGNTWPIIVYTEAENFGRFSTSSAFHRLQTNGRINVRSLPEGLYFPSWSSVSNFLTDPWLWNDLAPAENIFMFQADSILCSNSARSVDDYLEYDMIGAPIIERYGKGYNGGLSLRKRKTFLRIIEEFPYGPRSRPHPEDQWFFARLSELKAQEEKDGVENGIKLPSMEIARTFAVETIDYPHPLGFHQPTRFIRNHMVSIDDYCPEYKLATKARIRG